MFKVAGIIRNLYIGATKGYNRLLVSEQGPSHFGDLSAQAG
jgi:hypothetical protein